jgi:hypothetical protein
MLTRNSVVAALIVLLSCFAAYADGINNATQDGVNGQFGNGIWAPSNAKGVTPPPPPYFTPVVVVNNCNITVPVTTGVNVGLVGGGTCSYTATCGGLACAGGNAVTSWAITAQSLANGFSITSGGTLQGGSNASSVITASTYTVTVTATNPTGTSTPVIETIITPGAQSAPIVVAQTCSITIPVTNGSPVALQGGGNCIFTATCAGVACTGGNAITGWGIVSQSCASCFSIDNSGDLLGGVNASNVADGNTYTITVTASNAVGNSPQQSQNIITPTLGGLLLEAGGSNFLLLEDGVSHLCLESGC